MAKAGEPRLRTLSAVFGLYLLLVVAVAYVLAPAAVVYLDPGATFWILAAYLLLGALALVGVCAAAVRAAMRLDARLRGLGALQRKDAGATPTAVNAADDDVAPVLGLGTPDALPTDEDVERLLLDLRRVGEEAVARAWPSPEPEGLSRRAAEAAARLRDARGREIRRLTKAREAVAATAAGPAVASIGLLGVFAALLPASDGMLLANLQLNAIVGVAGLGGLIGIAAYAAAAFRQLSRRAGR